MAIKKIIQIGAPLLRESSILVEDFFSANIKGIIQNLIDTHQSAGGVGLAAPQIGNNLKIFITELPVSPTRSEAEKDDLRIYINPVITEFSTEIVELYESCLSIASGDFCLPVERPKLITVEAFDSEGRKFRLKCNGFLARVIQHEFDHLEGVLFTERTTKYREAISIEHYRLLNKSNEDMQNKRRISIKDFIYL